MSITSVGASFGYVDPRTVAGATSDVDTSSQANDAPSAATPGTSGSTSTIPDDQPRFAPATGAALIEVQEQANSPRSPTPVT